MYILKYSDYLVPVHNTVSKPTTQCTYYHIQCTLQHTATLCSLQPNIQCTYYSSHCTSSAHTTAAIASSVHMLQQPLHLQCTLQPCTAMYSYLQPIFSEHCSQLQPTAAIYNHLHYNYTIQCTLQLHYLMLIPYSASSEEG